MNNLKLINNIDEKNTIPEFLTDLEEGLKVIKSKIKNEKGFPFDLPNLMWLDKLFISQEFLKTIIDKLQHTIKSKKLLISIQTLSEYISSIFSENTLVLMRKIKISESKYRQLRDILSQDSLSAKQIKSQIQLFMKRLKKQGKRHSHFLIIINRLKKYWKYLFHGYDDERIPLTNLEIERSFNSFKRSFRKRTGLKSRSAFFVMEGEILITLDYMKNDISLTRDFEAHFQALHYHRLGLMQKKWHQRQKQRANQQKYHKNRYHKKYSLKEAIRIFHNLKHQISSR